MIKMKKYDEGKKLVKVKVLFDGSRGWTLSWGNKFKTFFGSNEDFAKVLKKVKAKDNFKQPKSFRSMTYLSIVKEINSGADTTIWIWEKDLKQI